MAETYISLLRGINVSGQKKIPMADLRALYEKLGFRAVSSYIQSGNVVFRTEDTDAGSLVGRIAGAIKDQYRFDVDVQVRTRAQWVRIAEGNPFLPARQEAINRLYVTLLAGDPEPEHWSELELTETGRERWKHSGRTIYLYCPEGYGRAKLNNNFLESKLKVRATTRNWKTVRALKARADQVDANAKA